MTYEPSTSPCGHGRIGPVTRRGSGSGVLTGFAGRGKSALLVYCAGGCASRSEKEAQRAVSAYFVGDYEGAQRRLRPLAAETNENFVLNNVRLGAAALANYDLGEAEAALLRAYEVINSVGVNDGGRSLGAVLVDEKVRVWRGEPYERAMVNFYLGVVYYMREDYANARAAFENALFKLRDYGENRGGDEDDVDADEYREAESNFAIGYLMLGKSNLHLGRDDDAHRNFERAAELRPYLRPVASVERNEESNFLLIVDFGSAPQKVTGFDGSTVGFAPHPGEVPPPPEASVVVDGRRIDLDGTSRPPIDLIVTAQDRRWQSLDTIRAVKSAVGTGLIAGGAIAASQRRARPELALGLIAAGLLLKATSQADVRQWEMLPRSVYVLPLYLPPGPHDVTIEFPEMRGMRQTWRGLVAPEEGEATYYVRMLRYNPGPFDWPPPALLASGESQAPRPRPNERGEFD